MLVPDVHWVKQLTQTKGYTHTFPAYGAGLVGQDGVNLA